jgi:hypothetical protein
LDVLSKPRVDHNPATEQEDTPGGTGRLNHQPEGSHDDVIHHVPGLDRRSTNAPGCSLLNIIERSITADRLAEELKTVFAVASGPTEGAAHSQWSEIHFLSAALVLRRMSGHGLLPPRMSWDNGRIESFDERLRKECLNRNQWNTLLEARVVIGDCKDEHIPWGPPNSWTRSA